LAYMKEPLPSVAPIRELVKTEAQVVVEQ